MKTEEELICELTALAQVPRDGSDADARAQARYEAVLAELQRLTAGRMPVRDDPHANAPGPKITVDLNALHQHLNRQLESRRVEDIKLGAKTRKTQVARGGAAGANKRKAAKRDAKRPYLAAVEEAMRVRRRENERLTLEEFLDEAQRPDGVRTASARVRITDTNGERPGYSVEVPDRLATKRGFTRADLDGCWRRATPAN